MRQTQIKEIKEKLNIKEEVSLPPTKAKNGKRASIEDLIDRYGLVCEQIKELEKTKELLRAQLLSYLGEGTYQGTKYQVSIDKRVNYEFNPVDVYKKLGLKAFLQVVKVQASQLARFIPQVELNKFASVVKETLVVSVKEKGGK